MALIERQIKELRGEMNKGGPREAAIRALIYVRLPEKAVDERGFEMLRRIRAEHGVEQTLAEIKKDLREQYFMLRLDEKRAVSLIPQLLKGHEQVWPAMLEFVSEVATASGPLGKESKRRLTKLEQILEKP